MQRTLTRWWASTRDRGMWVISIAAEIGPITPATIERCNYSAANDEKKKEEEGWRNKKWFKEKRGEREKEREKKRIFIDKFWSVSEKKKSYFKRRNLSLSLLLLSRSHSLVFDRWKNRKERGELSAILNFHPRHVLLDMYRDSIRETRLCLQCPLEIGGGRGG